MKKRRRQQPPHQAIRNMPKIGDRVKLTRLPPWVAQLPHESREVFKYCVGKVFPIDEIDQNGLLVLNVSDDVDQRFGGFGNDIRVEPEFVEAVS